MSLSSNILVSNILVKMSMMCRNHRYLASNSSRELHMFLSCNRSYSHLYSVMFHYKSLLSGSRFLPGQNMSVEGKWLPEPGCSY